MGDKLEYELRKLSVSELQEDIDRLRTKLLDDSQLRMKAIDKMKAINEDFKPEDLQQLKNDQAITANLSGVGLDPATTAVIVSFSPLAAKILKDLWVHVILPKIRADRAKDSIKEKEKD